MTAEKNNTYNPNNTFYTKDVFIKFFETYDFERLNKFEKIIQKLKHLIPSFNYDDFVKRYSAVQVNLDNLKQNVVSNSKVKDDSIMNSIIKMNNILFDVEEQLNKIGNQDKLFENEFIVKISAIEETPPNVNTVEDYNSKYEAICKDTKDLKLGTDNESILDLVWVSVYETTVWRKAIEGFPFPEGYSANSPPQSSSEISTSKEKLSEPLQSVPLPLNLSPKTSSNIYKSKMNNFFENYDLDRLYALYGIYYKLCEQVKGYDPWAQYDASIKKMKVLKDGFSKKKRMINSIISIFNRRKKADESLVDLINNIEGDIGIFDEKLRDIKTKEGFKEDIDEAKKVKHYSRFNRFFLNEIPKKDAILSLLHVYEYELKLWRDAIPQPVVEPEEDLPKKEDVAQDDSSQIQAVKRFLDRFSKETICKDKTAKAYSDGEEYIRVYISILEKIAVDEQFKGITPNVKFTAPNSERPFSQSIKDDLKKKLEEKILSIINLKKSVGTTPSVNTFSEIKTILSETTELINQVEKYLDSRIKLMDKKDFNSLFHEGIIEKRYYSVGYGSAVGFNATIIFYIMSAFGIAGMSALALGTMGIGAGLGILVAIITVYVMDKINHSKSPLLTWGMIKLYGGLMKYIWKKNNWGTYNPNEKWCVTINNIKTMTKPYEKIWLLMLYTEKRTLWENLTSPFFTLSTVNRGTFMDKKEENEKKINASLSRWILSKMSMSRFTKKKLTNNVDLKTRKKSIRGNNIHPILPNGLIKKRLQNLITNGRVKESNLIKPNSNRNLPLGQTPLGTAIGGTRKLRKHSRFNSRY